MKALKHSYLFFVIALLLCLACNKEDTNPENEFFIEALIDGVLERCDLPSRNPISNDPLFPPGITTGTATLIMRSAVDSSSFWNVGFTGEGHPDNWTFPKVFPGVSFIPQTDLTTVTFVPAQGLSILNCQVNDDFRLVLNSINGRILEGTFSGSAVREDQCNPNPAEILQITAGRFRVRL